MHQNPNEEVLLEVWIGNDFRRIDNIKRYEAGKILKKLRTSGEVKGFSIEPIQHNQDSRKEHSSPRY